MTPSDFELNSHPEFAKTYAYHLEISANRRPLVENEKPPYQQLCQCGGRARGQTLFKDHTGTISRFLRGLPPSAPFRRAAAAFREDLTRPARDAT